MSHSHISNRIHCIFSTQGRRKSITPVFQPRLWGYLGGTAKRLGIVLFAVGGTDDHVHLLIGLPATMTLASAIQKLKSNSSRWMSQETQKDFEWQEGYGAFSVSISQVDATIAYINNQEKHHRKRPFDDEWTEILKRHGIVG